MLNQIPMPMTFGDGQDDTRMALIVASLIASAVYFIFTNKDSFPGRTLIKALGVGLLTVYVAMSLPQPVPAAGWWLVGGLAFSTLGDIFLSLDRGKLFVQGLGAFLMGHIAYVIAYTSFIPLPFDPLVYELAGAALVLLFGGASYVWLFPGLGKMALPVFFYVLVIAVMAMASIFAELQSNWVVIGAVLFMVSDLMIAIEKFKRPFPAAGQAIWATYYGAQWLIGLGLLAALLGQTG